MDGMGRVIIVEEQNLRDGYYSGDSAKAKRVAEMINSANAQESSEKPVAPAAETKRSLPVRAWEGVKTFFRKEAR